MENIKKEIKKYEEQKKEQLENLAKDFDIKIERLKALLKSESGDKKFSKKHIETNEGSE